MIDVEVSAKGAACAATGAFPAWAAGQFISFSFSPEWAGLQKTALISNGTESVEFPLASDGEAIEIPTE